VRGRKLGVCLTIALMLSAGEALDAQPQGSITGVVTDASGNPLFGATVLVTGSSLSGVTDERGEFRIAGVTPGVVELRARRLGFLPAVRQARVQTQRNERVELKMTPLPTMLQPVLVHTPRVEYRGRLAGYYERLRRRSGGQFITRDMLERKQFRSLSQVLSQSPGVRSYGLRGGGGVVRMRGQNCRPLVWLDGVPMPAGEVDLDAFPVSTIHGIELYLGGTTAPPDFMLQRGASNCGTILLWSRGRDTDPARSPELSRVDLDSLVTSIAVYTADQVDTPAVRDPQYKADVAYPPELLAEGTSGSVVAEFVVDGDGRIETHTIRIVSSSHEAFSAAVTAALPSVPFTAAKKAGRAVRQVVQQPFLFSAGSGVSQTR
jgi:TonB family protein